jgi:hypothetical protein
MQMNGTATPRDRSRVALEPRLFGGTPGSLGRRRAPDAVSLMLAESANGDRDADDR